LATRFWIKLAISKGQTENILKKLKERKLTPQEIFFIENKISEW
jgi:hypothetical protein